MRVAFAIVSFMLGAAASGGLWAAAPNVAGYAALGVLAAALVVEVFVTVACYSQLLALRGSHRAARQV